MVGRKYGLFFYVLVLFIILYVVTNVLFLVSLTSIRTQTTKNSKKEKVVVSFTTSPSRMNTTFSETIFSMLAQSRLPDRVVCVLPLLYHDESQYDEELIKDLSARGVEFIRVEKDFGPLTRLIPLVKEDLGEDFMIILCDDDVVYDLRVVETLEREMLRMREKKNAFGFSGIVYQDREHYLVTESFQFESLNSVTLLENFASAIFWKSFFGRKFAAYVENVIENKGSSSSFFRLLFNSLFARLQIWR